MRVQAFDDGAIGSRSARRVRSRCPIMRRAGDADLTERELRRGQESRGGVQVTVPLSDRVRLTSAGSGKL